MLVKEVLRQDPFGGHLFLFRGKRGDRVKVLWWDTQGLVLYAKRLDQGRFTWPSTGDAPGGTVTLTPAQRSTPLEGLEWRTPVRTWVPATAG